MAKFNQMSDYAFDTQAFIDALQQGHFNCKHNTVWTALNKRTYELTNIQPLPGRVIKSHFRKVAANYPGTGTRGATDAGAMNAGRHISALVKLGVLVPV